MMRFMKQVSPFSDDDIEEIESLSQSILSTLQKKLDRKTWPLKMSPKHSQKYPQMIKLHCVAADHLLDIVK